MKRLIFVSALLSLAACQTVPAGITETPASPPVIEQETSTPAPETAETPAADTPALLRAQAAELQLEAEALNADLAELNDALAGMADARKELVDAAAGTDNEAELEQAATAIEQIDTSVAAIQVEKRAVIAEIEETTSRADTLLAEADELETRLAEAAANDEEVITFVVMEDQIRSDETPAPTATPASTQRDRRTLLDYSDSALIWSLLSDQLRNDDVAIMGVVSGARSYCGLNWQQGFAQFIQIAAQNGWDVTAIAEEHGRFMGGARRSLQEAGYQCNANDLQTLEAIYP